MCVADPILNSRSRKPMAVRTYDTYRHAHRAHTRKTHGTIARRNESAPKPGRVIPLGDQINQSIA